MTHQLIIKSFFWKKDTISLFDYESKDLVTSELKVKQSCKIINDTNEKIKLSDKLKKHNITYLASINKPSIENKNNLSFKIEEEFYFNPKDNNIKVPSDNWLIIRHSYSYNDYGFKLREGNIIKLGKVVFKVRELSVFNEDDNERNDLYEKEYKLDKQFTNEIMSNNFYYEDDVGNENEGYDGVEDDSVNNLEENNFFENENNYDVYSNSNNDYFSSSNNNVAVFNNMTNDNISYSKNIYFKNEFINNLQQTPTENLTNTMMVRVHSKNQIGFNKKYSKNSFKNPSWRKNNTGNICRICFGDGTEDILVSVCKCAGSVKYIHLNCAKKWLISKISIKTFNHLTVYSYKFLECELCKAPVNETISLKGRIINLINLNQVTEVTRKGGRKYLNYIALECIKEKPPNPEREKKTIYVINLKDKPVLKIGRSTESDVRMTDISVSRNHAVLHIQNNCMYLKDINSKFGSHVNIPLEQEITFIPYKKLSIQCGRYFLSFDLIKTYLALFCCFKDYSKQITYEDYNEHFEEEYNKLLKAKEEKEKEKEKEICVLTSERSPINANNDVAEVLNMNSKKKNNFYLQKTFNAVSVMKKLDLNHNSNSNSNSNINNYFHENKSCKIMSTYNNLPKSRIRNEYREENNLYNYNLPQSEGCLRILNTEEFNTNIATIASNNCGYIATENYLLSQSQEIVKKENNAEEDYENDNEINNKENEINE